MPNILFRRISFPWALNILILFLYGVLISLNVIRFDLWSQIRYFTDLCPIVSPLELIAIEHPHLLRYLLMWCFAKLSLAMHYDLADTFSWLVFSQILLMVFMQTKIVGLLRPKQVAWKWDSTCILAIWVLI